MNELMYDVNLGVIAVILLLLALGAIEAGFRFGRRTKASANSDSKVHVNNTQTSTLGILALLLAFTFSLSLQRFESRSDAVVDEANTIGTAYLRSHLVPPALRNDVQALLRSYVDLRIEADTVATVHGDWPALVAKATRVQTALWDRALRAAELDPNHVASGLFIQALNDMIDSFGRRDAILNRHVPEIVLWLLFVTFAITGVIVGFAAGVGGQRPSWVSFAMVVLIVVLILVVLDLDRPRRGLITVSEKSMLDLQASIRNDAGAAAAPALAASAARPASTGQR